MKITASGQISLPAEVRRRWNVHRIRLIDLGDHLELHPVPDDVVATTIGAFAGRTSLTADEMKRLDRDAEDAEEEAADAGVRRRTPRQRVAG